MRQTLLRLKYVYCISLFTFAMLKIQIIKGWKGSGSIELQNDLALYCSDYLHNERNSSSYSLQYRSSVKNIMEFFICSRVCNRRCSPLVKCFLSQWFGCRLYVVFTAWRNLENNALSSLHYLLQNQLVNVSGEGRGGEGRGGGCYTPATSVTVYTMEYCN